MSCCSSSCSCCDTETECSAVCTAITVTNSWNVPSCGNSAVLAVPGLTVALVGSYIWNPTYGWFKVTAVDSINYQLTILNECLESNADAGTVVPSDTVFVFGAPPGSTTVNYTQSALGVGYTITGSVAPVVFGTTSPVITITQPGTYLLEGYLGVSASALTNAAYLTVNGGFYRTNNTAGAITNYSLFGVPPVTGLSNILSGVRLAAYLYTTTNSNDLLTMNASYTGAIGAGNLVVQVASITAIKLY